MTSDQESKLIDMIQHHDHEKLTQWERDRLIEWADKYDKEGAKMWLSPKQWFVLERIEEKVYGR